MDLDPKVLLEPSPDLTYPTAGAIGATVLLYRLNGEYNEPFAECTCWLLVLFWFHIVEVYKKGKNLFTVSSSAFPSAPRWVAVGIVLAALARWGEARNAEWVMVRAVLP